MNWKIVASVVASLIVGLVIGFFAGMEYKAYEVRNAVQQAFTEPSRQNPEASQVLTDDTMMTAAKEANYETISKTMGDEVALATLKFKVNGVKEASTISSGYGSPKTAKNGAKFVVVELGVENTTNSSFDFFPDDGLRLVDSQKREFTTYPDSVGGVTNYLNVRKLAPGVVESGVIVYEVPENASNYSLVTSKAGANELYQVNLN